MADKVILNQEDLKKAAENNKILAYVLEQVAAGQHPEFNYSRTYHRHAKTLPVERPTGKEQSRTEVIVDVDNAE